VIERVKMEFDYEKELDPRQKDYYIVYPRVKLWHILLVCVTGLGVTHYLL